MVMYDYIDKKIMDNTKIKVLFIGGKNIPIDVHTHIKEIENNILLLNTYIILALYQGEGHSG